MIKLNRKVSNRVVENISKVLPESLSSDTVFELGPDNVGTLRGLSWAIQEDHGIDYMVTPRAAKRAIQACNEIQDVLGPIPDLCYVSGVLCA